MTTAILLLLLTYLLGSVPFGYLVARLKGIDIFTQGSGNIGATNVGRVLGKGYGVLVFILDFAKGAACVLVAKTLAVDRSLPADALPIAAGLGAFLGHLFPIYLGFRGGKGVATGAGVVTVLLPGPLALALAAWVAVLCATRMVSLASVAAAACLALFRLFATPDPLDLDHALLTGFCVAAALLVLLRHRSNLRRVLRGNENRIKDTPAMQHFTKTVHVLALGLWFGTIAFFTFGVALSLFDTFERIGMKSAAERPLWFPAAPAFDHDAATRKEQGTRAAGAAVGPLFERYFGVQAVCAILCLVTALSLSGPGRDQRWRVYLISVATLTVAVGWGLDWKVTRLREVRDQAQDAALLSTGDWSHDEAVAAVRADFTRWHLASLLVNFLTIGCVTVAMALAGRLPDDTQPVLRPSDGGPRA